MKKGGVTEINSFISVASSGRTSSSKTAVNRRRISVQKVTPAKPDTSAVEKKVLSRNPALNDNASSTSKSLLPNKTRVTEAPRKSIRMARLDRNAQMPGENSALHQSEKLPMKKLNLSNPIRENIQRKSVVENTSRRPSIILKAKKSDLPLRKDSVSSFPKTDTIADQQSANNSFHVLEKAVVNEDYEYEDDFEDYESDFESLSESENLSSDVENDVQVNPKVLVEEEKKMDSGSYDLTYLHQLQKQKKQLEVIKEALNKENTAIVQQSSDSIVEQNSYYFDSDISRGSADKKILLDFNARSMENFASAKKRQHNSKIAHKIASRGERLLQMITLDSMNFTLFEMAPIPYHIFMRSYARKNTTQAFTQTNEDNVSCEIQTDDISYQTKWTQYPVNVTKQMLEDEQNLSEILTGVGDEKRHSVDNHRSAAEINTQKLINFMKYAGEEIIAFLEEELFKTELRKETYVSKNTEISECISYLKIESLSFLFGRPIISVQYDPCNISRILTIHGLEIQGLEKERHYYLCIWNVHQFWKPNIVLKSHNRVTSCCFSGYHSSFVIAGHEDGSICLWNLRENFVYSEKLSVNNTDIGIKYPSFNSAEIRVENPTHQSKVICVESTKSNNIDLRNQNEMRFEKVFSIDENNILIIWSLSPGSKTKVVPWCKSNFFIDQILDFSSNLPKTVFQTTCLKIFSESKVLIGTDVGSLIECNLYVKRRKIHRKYSSKTNSEKSRVTCLEICPYNHQYFVAGYSNGNIDLFNAQYTEPISNVQNYSPFSSAINSVQWLWNKLDHVLVLDFNFLCSIYRFYPDNYSLICRCKTEGVNAIKVSSSDHRWQHNTLYLAFLIGDEIQVHKLKSNEDWTR